MVAENLFQELWTGTVLAVVTVIIHGAGLLILAKILRVEGTDSHDPHVHPISIRGALVTVGVVLGLFVLHGAEIWLYAVTYWFLNAIADFSTALYFSTITYAAIGYDSHPLDPRWRMLAGIEGINGLILLGWSTAFFVTVMGRIRRL
jgi:hypothetical protein